MYRPVESIYDDPLLMLDLSKAVRTFFRAGTVSAGGVLIGTDKIIHFINVGGIYHQRYLDAVARGWAKPRPYSMRCTATAANPLLSENGILGLYTTGIRSNGDLAADYAGLKFYRNLSEPVRVGAALLPPMLQRDGQHWRVVVQDEDTVFTRFVSPHWNEVLNPNSYLALRRRPRAQRHRQPLRRRGRLVSRRPRPAAGRRLVRHTPARAVHFPWRTLRPRTAGRTSGERGRHLPVAARACRRSAGDGHAAVVGRPCRPRHRRPLGRNALW